MHRKPMLGLPLALLLAVACSRDESPAAPPVADEPAAVAASPGEEPAMSDGHNSRNSLDWAGTYSGVLPCASCPGIETVITLREDGTFESATLYIDEAPMPKSGSGTFSWNAAGSRITLDSGGSELQQYQVGENVLFHLDRSGERINGELASKYVLEKHLHDPAIEGKEWKLVELRGAPIEPGQAPRDAVLTLRAEDSVATGNSSCNRFSGGYAIKSGQRISFARNMAVTMMACPDMSLESAFLDVLSEADSYAVGSDGTLSLEQANMAPLARFTMVE